MIKPKIGQFIKTSSTRIGVVVGNENSGGVFRGHCNVWFGVMAGDEILCEHLLICEDWEEIETPISF